MRCAIPKIEELFDFGEWVGRNMFFFTCKALALIYS